MKALERADFMSNRIQLAVLAKEVMLDKVLTGRILAKRMFDTVQRQPSTFEAESVIYCDFNRITACDVSFADAFVISIQREMQKYTNSLLIIENANQDILENLDGALALRNEKDDTKLNLLIVQYDGYHLLGKLEKNLQEAFSVLSDRHEITAREIAQRFEVEINSASNRLKKLFDARLIQRKELLDPNGRQHVYYLP